MNLLADLKMYGRFMRRLPGFLSHTMAADEARAIVRHRIAEREPNFLRLVQKGVYGYESSPYRALLQLAHAEFGDIQNLVHDKGLEDALTSLKKAGVYVTFEEFKGRKRIVRHGKEILAQARDFDNPFLRPCYESESGGSTGAGTRVGTDLEHLADRAANFLLAHEVHGTVNAPAAVWRGVLPDSSGINSILCSAKMGNVPRKWFTPFTSRDVNPSVKYRLATRSFVAAGRLCGAPIPAPEPVSPDQAGVVARWAAETVRSEKTCYISASASMSLRVCLAAKTEGLDIAGTVFSSGGEPLTQAKFREIATAGARCCPGYHFTEAGLLGTSCGQAVDASDQHFFKDTFGLIQHPRTVDGAGIEVGAFYFTTLLSTAPKILLNVESDDYGTVEQRSCDCPLGGYGLTVHLRNIHSFSKLTTEGVTLVGSEMLHILDELLPARFGGSALDYQLLEEEDEQGHTTLNLLVSPKVDISNSQEVIEFVLQSLAHSSAAADSARAIWSQAGTLRLQRKDPIWTARGKLMPLHFSATKRSSDSES